MILLKNVPVLCLVWLFLFHESVSCPETSGGGNHNVPQHNTATQPSSSRLGQDVETANYDEIFGEEALRHYTAASEEQPSEWLYYRLRGLCYLKMRNYNLAIQNFREAIAKNHEGQVDRIFLCLTLFDAAKFADAKKELAEWSESDLVTLAKIFQSRNKFLPAITCYTTAILSSLDLIHINSSVFGSSNFIIPHTMGFAKIDGYTKLSSVEFIYVLERRSYLQRKNPNQILYYEERAMCHRRNGSFGHAIRDYEKLFLMAPEKEEYHVSFAKTLVDMGDVDKAIEEIFLTNAAEIAVLGNMLSNAGKFEEALQCYDEAIKRQHGNADFHWKRGLIFLELKKEYETLHELKMSLMISPNPFRKLFLIELLLDARRFDQANMEMVTVHHTFLYRLAEGMFEMEKFEQALHCCTAAIYQAPQNGKYYLLRGKCNWKKKNRISAIDDFKEVLRLDRDLASLNFWMDFCDVLLEAGKSLDAKIILEEKIKKSELTENDQVRSEEFQKRILEITEKEETEHIPLVKRLDIELVKLLRRDDRAQPSITKGKGEVRNLIDLNQPQAVEEDYNELAELLEGIESTQPSESEERRKIKGKDKIDSNQPQAGTQTVEEEESEPMKILEEAERTQPEAPKEKRKKRGKNKIDSNQPQTDTQTAEEEVSEAMKSLEEAGRTQPSAPKEKRKRRENNKIDSSQPQADTQTVEKEGSEPMKILEEAERTQPSASKEKRKRRGKSKIDSNQPQVGTQAIEEEVNEQAKLLKTGESNQPSASEEKEKDKIDSSQPQVDTQTVEKEASELEKSLGKAKSAQPSESKRKRRRRRRRKGKGKNEIDSGQLQADAQTVEMEDNELISTHLLSMLKERRRIKGKNKVDSSQPQADTQAANEEEDYELMQLIKMGVVSARQSSASEGKGKEKQNETDSSQLQADKQAVEAEDSELMLKLSEQNRDRKGKNKIDSSQAFEEEEEDPQHEEGHYRLRTRGGQHTTPTVPHGYSLRTRKEPKTDARQSSTSGAADTDDESYDYSEELVSPRAKVSSPKGVKRKNPYLLSRMAAANLEKETRKRGKRKLESNERPDEDEQLDSTSEEIRKKNANREFEPLYQFADIILQAHEKEVGKLGQKTKKSSIQILKLDVADPRIVETGHGSPPEQGFKTRGMVNLYKETPELVDCLPERPRSGEEATTDEHQQVARVWANELRRIPDIRQRAIATNAINDILLEAQLGTLHENSVQIDGSTADENIPSDEQQMEQ